MLCRHGHIIATGLCILWLNGGVRSRWLQMRVYVRIIATILVITALAVV